MAEIITLTVKQVGVSEAEKSLNNMLTTIKAINSTPIKVSVTGSGAKAAEQYKEAVTVTKTEVKKLSQSFKDTEKSGDSLLKNVIKNAQWYYISGAVSAITRSFKEALATMKEADAEMVSIQKVTGYTKEQMDRLSDSAYALASAYGRTAQEILSAETTFARAGYTDQIEDLAELAVLTQNVGDVNADTASKFLIAADAAWKLGGNEKELTEIIDGMNNVTNKNAVDMKALTEGLTVSASAFAEAGESAQTYTAMVGAGVAATQRSGNEVARAMRTIIMNVRQIRGETEDGELIDGESIANAAKALKEYADISTLQNGELRKTYDVLDELAGKWENLGSVAKSAITEALAGKYRANILSALLNDWDSVSKMMQDYADGVGSALEENEFYLQSWDAKTKKLQSTWTEFVAKTVDEDWIKGLISSVTWLIEGIGSLGNALLILGGIIATFKMPSILSFLSSAVAGIGRLIAMVKLATTNFTAFRLVANTTQLAIGAITAAITIGIVAYNKIKQAQEEARQAAIDAGNAAAQEAESLKDLYQSYTDAKKAYEDGTGSKTALREATEKLSKSLGTETKNIDTLTLRYGSYKVAVDEATKSINANMEAKLQADLYDAKAGVTAAGYALVNNGGVTEEFGAKTPEKVLEYYNQFISSRNEMIDSGTDSGATWQNVTREISKLKPLVDEYNTAIANQTELENKLQAVRDGTLDSYGRENELLEENNQLTDENNQKTSEKVSKIQEHGKALKQQESDLAAVSAALGEYRINGNISASTLQSLIGLSDKYVEMLTDEDGQLRITEESLKAVASAILEDVDATQQQIGASSSADEAATKFVSSLLDVAENAGYSGKALYDLALEIIKLNETGLDLSAQIAQVIALGRAAGATAASIASISGIKSSDADRTIKGWIQTGQVGSYEEGEQKLLQGIYDSFDYSESSWNKAGSSGSKGSRSGGGGSSSDARLTAHKERVTLLKSELTLLEKQGASEDAQKAKMREIQDALSAQADYMRSIGASQADINDLSSEWYDWQKKIKEQTKSMDDLLSELKDAMQDSLSSQQDARDAELAALDAQLDALKRQKETKDDQLTLEEKILAVQKAQADLANAQNERTVRQWNASTGQWEWVADEGNVKSAKDSLEKAEKDLKDFQDDLAYNAAVAEIEARKDAINAQYDALERQYNNFLDSLKAKTRGIGEILQDIWKNATPELKKIILENADIFRQFGVDVSKLSDAVNETANRIVKVGADGKAPSGLSVGDRVVTGGGTYEIIGVNPDGTYQSQLVDKNQTTYNYGGQYDAPPGGDSSGSSGSGLKYSGTVYAYAQDGSRYTISSKKGLDFLNYEAAGARMTGGDGTSWLKNYDGTTSITKKDGKVYTVYDRGGILEGIGGIKATAEPEMVLPPDITKAIQNMLLVPQADARFERGMDRMRAALCGDLRNSNVFAGSTYDDHHVGTQQNGCNFYSFGGVTISEGRARGMSVADFARSAATLAIQKNM
jgi:chromosome segregation ATPase